MLKTISTLDHSIAFQEIYILDTKREVAINPDYIVSIVPKRFNVTVCEITMISGEKFYISNVEGLL